MAYTLKYSTDTLLQRHLERFNECYRNARVGIDEEKIDMAQMRHVFMQAALDAGWLAWEGDDSPPPQDVGDVPAINVAKLSDAVSILWRSVTDIDPNS